MKKYWWWGAVVGCLLVPAVALGQSDESARRAARQLGTEGIEAYDAGSYVQAEEKLARAYAVIDAPTLGLWLARSREKNGKLVAASELYLEVSRATVEADAPDVLREAVADAAKEYEALQAKIPALTITLATGETTQGVELFMDGNPLRAALLGVPISVDPGRHEFELRRDGKVLKGAVELAVGEKKAVELTFKKQEAPAAAAAAPAAAASNPPPPAGGTAAPAAGQSPTEDRGPAPSGKGQRIGAFVAFGVGAAGLAAGGALGILALKSRSDLDDNACIETKCATWLGDDVDTYNQYRTLSTVGFIVGGVGAAAGTALLLTAPKGHSTARVEAFVGLGQAGVKGRF